MTAEQIAEKLLRFAPDVIEVVGHLIDAIGKHEDPKRAAERAAAAVASEKASEAAIREILDRERR